MFKSKKSAIVATIALLAVGIFSIQTPAQAAPTTLTETFTNASLDNPSNWVASQTGNTGIHPCLTSLSSNSTPVALSNGTSLSGCKPVADAAGQGGLILTTNGAGQTATMLYNAALPTSAGADISFFQAQYGGTGADGISFFTKDGSLSDTATGVAGGGLGYKGLPGGLFGVGFDSFGNWLNSSGSMDNACPNPAVVKKALAIRGADTSPNKDGSVGFCVLPGGSAGSIGAEYFGTSSDTRQTAARPVRIIVDPSTDAAPKIRVYMWKTGTLTQDVATADVTLIADQPAEYKAAKTFKFGFSASTGGANDNHAVWGLTIAPKVPAVSPKLYVVPDSSTVVSGQAATYTYKIYSDAARTTSVDTTKLSNFKAPVCVSAYTTATAGPASLPITCSGTTAALYEIDQSDTSTLTVTPAPVVNYTVSYNGNGNTGGIAPPGQTYTSTSGGVVLRGNIDSLVKTGFVFSGWNTATDGTGTSYAAGATFNETASRTLYARWLADTSTSTYAYSISFDANGGTGTMATLSGTGSSVKLPANAFTLLNNKFTGWKDGAGKAYADSETITLTTVTALSLKAQWTPETVTVVTPTFPYAIAFAPGGGTGTMANLTGTGSSVTVPANGYTYTGYTFSGWKVTGNVGGVTGTTFPDYQSGQVLNITGNTSLTFTAQWTKIPEVPANPVNVPAVNNDKIISIAPASGFANDQIVVTGEFANIITGISVDGLNLPKNSWAQTKTTVTFTAPGHPVGPVVIKLTNGLTPELAEQKFEYLPLKDLDLGIKVVITSLGTFDSGTVMKPGATQPVSFALNSNALSPKSIKILKSWKLNLAKSVLITGYASASGTKALNDKLTKKRAQEVAAWVKKNWPKLKIQAVGAGTKVNRLCKPYDNKCAMITIVKLAKG